ncbi:sialate O-acetylesterase [Victivallis vadensis]|uniref:Sialate O-acetylesterase n=1 Tax=Victivallis vadensis TaxID=172901 RepID=A0A848AV01_9BACT|nr:sialate O-acetylesterase [Victivallis vadensis]NMD85410.1 sialate O-acetylesterase [Victivallis vadensis]
MKVWRVLILLGAGIASAAVEMPPVFSDFMVLQRDVPLRLAGRGDAGEQITVEFAGQRRQTVVDSNRNWQIRLEPLEACREGLTLSVQGNTRLEFYDVLVGDVWLCSGQSNMYFRVKDAADGTEIAARQKNRSIRMLKIEPAWSREPRELLVKSWQTVRPDNAPMMGALPLLLAEELQRNLDVPVGIIDNSMSGTRIEVWTYPPAFRSVPALRKTAEWAEAEIARMTSWPRGTYQGRLNRLPALVFNAMVWPVTPFQFRGVIWYQGEGNHTEGMLYAEKLRALTGGWRKLFHNPQLPFYIVQLPPFDYWGEDPGIIPELRRAQQCFVKTDRNAALVVTSDLGDPADIHPKDKRPLATRIAGVIQAREFEGDSAGFSPMAQRAIFEVEHVVVEFADPNGLKSRDGKPLNHLEIAGKDGIFHQAEGTIDHERLIIASPLVPEPVSVRFGWHKLANPNLVNRCGVPAAPFKFDKEAERFEGGTDTKGRRNWMEKKYTGEITTSAVGRRAAAARSHVGKRPPPARRHTVSGRIKDQAGPPRCFYGVRLALRYKTNRR